MNFKIREIRRPSGSHFAIENEDGIEFARAFTEDIADIIRRALKSEWKDEEAA